MSERVTHVLDISSHEPAQVWTSVLNSRKSGRSSPTSFAKQKHFLQLNDIYQDISAKYFAFARKQPYSSTSKIFILYVNWAFFPFSNISLLMLVYPIM